jgi:hypothetical protein
MAYKLADAWADSTVLYFTMLQFGYANIASAPEPRTAAKAMEAQIKAAVDRAKVPARFGYDGDMVRQVLLSQIERFWKDVEAMLDEAGNKRPGPRADV